MFNYDNQLKDIKKQTANPFKKVFVGALAGMGFIILLNCFSVVPTGNRGILVKFGAVQNQILNEGIHFVSPVVDVKKMNVQIQKLEADAPSYSKDLQTVSAKIALNYRVNASEVQALYQTIGIDFQTRVIEPSIQEAVKASTAKFTASELISNRPMVREEIKHLLSDRLRASYIEVIDFSIVNFDFSDTYEKAIEEKQVAQQKALKAENDLKRIEVEAQQRVAQAKAEAEAIRIQAEALKQSQELVSLEAVKKWNGVLPQYMMGDSVPFLSISK